MNSNINDNTLKSKAGLGSMALPCLERTSSISPWPYHLSPATHSRLFKFSFFTIISPSFFHARSSHLLPKLLTIMAHNEVRWLIVVLTLAYVVAVALSVGDGSDRDAEVLLKFKSSLSSKDPAALNNWNKSIDLCREKGSNNWAGLICNKGVFSGLRLENMSLTGIIDVDSLAELPTLRSLSFMNNSFDGPMPKVSKLGALKNLYLSLNRFSGEIPDDAFEGMRSLRRVHLARNAFRGKIPESLAALPRLEELSLEGNRFEGKIPDFRPDEWRVFNLADNQLKGHIPKGLSQMNSSSFVGNKDLCGQPLGPCKASKNHYIVIIIVLAIAVVALATLGAFSFIRSRRAQTSQYGKAQAYKNFGAYDVGRKEAESAELPADQDKKGELGKLFFVRNDRDRERFDLQDLLTAPAEVLGSGSFGCAYKAVLLSGPAMVVKRFRQMNKMGKEEFHAHMTRLGSLSHPNVLPPVAFHYSKEEKLLISDFVENGSLASHLHAEIRAPGQLRLDWLTRLRIIKGVARGLAYLHKEFPAPISLPHGHLKSSNVLLDCTFRPLLSEFALVPVISKEYAQQYMAAYKSPEFTQLDREDRKTDVWCLGILILEVLTGKFPANYQKHGKGENKDLAMWVNSVVREEWTGEVFDVDMKGTKNCEEEMLKLLKIGMCCCEWNVVRRWELREALEKIEELKERDSEDDCNSSYGSEGDMYSSRAMTEEDFYFLT